MRDCLFHLPCPVLRTSRLASTQAYAGGEGSIKQNCNILDDSVRLQTSALLTPFARDRCNILRNNARRNGSQSHIFLARLSFTRLSTMPPTRCGPTIFFTQASTKSRGVEAH